jgi:hypothetical protein
MVAPAFDHCGATFKMPSPSKRTPIVLATFENSSISPNEYVLPAPDIIIVSRNFSGKETTHSVSGTTKSPLVTANARPKIIFRLRTSAAAKREADASTDRKTQRFVPKANPWNFERRVDPIDVATNVLLKLDCPLPSRWSIGTQ